MLKYKAIDLLGYHVSLIGQVCKLTDHGVMLEYEYEKELGIGNGDRAWHINQYCHTGNRHEMSLMFIDQAAFKINNVVFYCLKEIGFGTGGDWHWYTLNQLMICN